MLNIYDFIFENCSEEDIAVIYEGNSITYYQLREKIDKASIIIHEAGISSNFRIGLMLDNSVDFIVLLMAFLKNENLVCLLNTQNDEISLNEKLHLSSNDVLICEDHIKDKIKRYQKLQPIIGKKEFFSSNFHHRFNSSVSDNSTNENVLIQSSSGTSGKAKLAYRTYENIKTDINNIVQSLTYEKTDTVYSPVPLCHGYGLTMGLFAPLKVGAKIIIEKWFMPNHFVDSCVLYSPNILLGTPEIYQLLSRIKKVNQVMFKSFKWLFSSGTPLTTEIGSSFYKTTHRWIHQVYGMMESSTISVNKMPNEQNLLSVGSPVQNVEVKIENGLLFIKGPAISSTYVSGDKVSDKNTGWFCTKDSGYINSEGYIFITKSNRNKNDLSIKKDEKS